MCEKYRYRKWLERAFCWKIDAELNLFRYQILQKDKEAIYHSAYQIDCMICIYELLMEMSEKLSDEVLETVIVFPNILRFLYEEWLEYEDSHVTDIQYCLDKELVRLRKEHRDMKEEKAV